MLLHRHASGGLSAPRSGSIYIRAPRRKKYLFFALLSAASLRSAVFPSFSPQFARGEPRQRLRSGFDGIRGLDAPSKSGSTAVAPITMMKRAKSSAQHSRSDNQKLFNHGAFTWCTPRVTRRNPRSARSGVHRVSSPWLKIKNALVTPLWRPWRSSIALLP